MRVIALILFCFCLRGLAQTKPDTLWTYKADKYYMGHPLLESGILYSGNEKGRVFALNTDTGEELWQTQVGKGLYHNVISAGDNIILVCAKHESNVISLNKKTGKQNWLVDKNYKFDDDVPCFLIVDGDRFLFNSLDSTIVSMDIKTGKEVWRFKAGGITSPPVINNNSVVFTCADGNIYQLVKQTGKLDSKITFGHTKRSFYLPPVIYENIIVFSDTGKMITAISLASKETIWKKESNSPFLFGFEDLAVSATDNGLYAYDIKTGKEKWAIAGEYKWYIYPCIFDNKFYYYSRKDSKLLVINNKGELLRQYYVKGKTYTAPRVTKDKIILSVSDKVFAIENK